MKTRFTRISKNRKVGYIPVTTTEESSCPNSCPLKKKNICYAKKGHTRMTWQEVAIGINRRWKKPFTNDYNSFIKEITKLPKGQLWRHNQAGDLAHSGDNESIDFDKLKQLVKANKGKNGFTYTHKTQLKENFTKIKYANDKGFTINLSANNLQHADELKKHNLPIAVIVGTKPINKTPAGHKIKMCPNQINKAITCQLCLMCSKKKRNYIVGFLKD
tara:strand:+ start:271 stop:921 length:651 start_codon:yes stop_codon:yes gene_type:complete